MRDGTTVGGWLACLVLAAGCNSIFGIDEGKPRPAGSAGKGGAASGTSGRGGAGNAPGSGGDSGEGGEVSAGNGGGAGKAGAGGAVGGTAGAGGTTGGASGAGGVGGSSGALGGEAGTATDGGEGGQPADPRPVASVWALWKMPNPAGSGLPNEADYDTSTPGVVLDKVTELIWQRVPGMPRNWDDAVSYCNDLELAGFDDYRVPSRIELVSIVDFTRSPTIDPVAFPDTPLDLFWTTSLWPETTGNGVYIVHFLGGYTSVSDRATGTTLPVRCVR